MIKPVLSFFHNYTNHSKRVRRILFFEHLGVIVSASVDRSIKVWDCEKLDVLKTFEGFHSQEVKDIMKFHQSEVISSGEDGKMFAYSIEKPYRVIKNFQCFSKQKFSPLVIFSTMKINNDSFLVSIKSNVELSNLVIVSYEDDSVIRILSSQTSYYDFSVPRLSYVFENCFYLNTKNDRHKVKLIDFKEDMVRKNFDSHNAHIYGMVIFRTSKTSEFVICGGWNKFIYVYDPSAKKFSEQLVKKISTSNWISSIYLYHNFLCVSEKGTVRIFELGYSSTDNESVCNLRIENLVDYEINQNIIYGISCSNIRSSNDFDLALGNSSGIISIVQIKGFQLIRNRWTLEGDYDEKDFFERIEFLHLEKKCYYFTEELEKEMNLEIRIVRSLDFKVMKFLMN